jgi:hypothetical protein
MARPLLLDWIGVCELDRVYRQAYADALALRSSEPLACYLHLPKLPELLSLSLAAITAPQLIGEQLQTGRRPHDLQTLTGAGVAVKGTGPTRWITVTASDRLAEWLIWVDYAERIRSGGPVEVLAVRVASGLLDAPARLKRAKFDERVRGVHACLLHPTTPSRARAA